MCIFVFFYYVVVTNYIVFGFLVFIFTAKQFDTLSCDCKLIMVTAVIEIPGFTVINL